MLHVKRQVQHLAHLMQHSVLQFTFTILISTVMYLYVYAEQIRLLI